MRRIQKKQYTLTTAGANFLTANVVTTSLNGFLRGIKVKSPATVENTASLATVITDADGDTLPLVSGFGTQAVNTTVKQFVDTQTQPNALQQAIAEALTITVTLSANQTVGRVVVVTLYIDSLV